MGWREDRLFGGGRGKDRLFRGGGKGEGSVLEGEGRVVC